jgi:hypothetical protein
MPELQRVEVFERMVRRFGVQPYIVYCSSLFWRGSKLCRVPQYLQYVFAL